MNFPKRILIVFFFFISIPFFAQQIPKGVNTIIIKTAIPKDSLVKRAIEVLTLLGYSIEKIDQSFGLIKTEPRTLKETWIGSYWLNVTISENNVVVKGSGKVNYMMGQSEQFFEAEFKGMEGGAPKRVFREMDLFAKNIDVNNISYQKR